MAVPKRKTSKARRDKRRASSYVLPKVAMAECPRCHAKKLPHHVCLECGYYKDEEVIAVE